MQKKSILLSTSAILALSLGGLASAGIANTKHNMSSSGAALGNAFYADPQATTGTDEICVFCHTPHMNVTKNATLPLWNHRMSSFAGSYSMYQSATFNQSALTLTKPTSTLDVGTAALSVTNLCLSCHDGTQAINAMLNTPNRQPSGPTMNATNGDTLTDPLLSGTGASNAWLGTDLSNDHPVNFIYADSIANGDTDLFPGTADNVGAVRLFSGTVQCASCHDPHVDYSADDTRNPFLRVSISGSTLCLTCHDK